MKSSPEVILALKRIYAMKNGKGHPHPLSISGGKMDSDTRKWLEDRLREVKAKEANEEKAWRDVEKAKMKAKKEKGYDSLSEALKDIKREIQK